MKLVILGDQHWGVRKNSPVFIEHFRKYYSYFFFPYLREHNLNQIIQLGDMFEDRNQINYTSLEASKAYFFEQLIASNINIDVLVGNHDSHKKNNLLLNSPRLLLNEYSSHVNVIDEPLEKIYSSIKILFIPWICRENQEECLDMITTSLANVCMGHFDIQGFEMFKNSMTSTKGLSQSLFERFELVLSGHFHTRSKQGNILYTGTPIEYCWSDYNDPKGFHILDTSTLELEFIENPYTIHEKHVFKTGEEPPQDVTGKYLKLFIDGPYNPVELDRWISNIEEQNPADLKKIETNFNIADVMDETTQIENVENYSILEIAKENIIDEDSYKIFNELYQEAIALNVNF